MVLKYLFFLILFANLAACDNVALPAAQIPSPQNPLCILFCRVSLNSSQTEGATIGDLDGTYTGGTYAPVGGSETGSTVSGGTRTVTQP